VYALLATCRAPRRGRIVGWLARCGWAGLSWRGGGRAGELSRCVALPSQPRPPARFVPAAILCLPPPCRRRNCPRCVGLCVRLWRRVHPSARGTGAHLCDWGSGVGGVEAARRPRAERGADLGGSTRRGDHNGGPVIFGTRVLGGPRRDALPRRRGRAGRGRRAWRGWSYTGKKRKKKSAGAWRGADRRGQRCGRVGH
jgi:hypothetical protein